MDNLLEHIEKLQRENDEIKGMYIDLKRQLEQEKMFTYSLKRILDEYSYERKRAIQMLKEVMEIDAEELDEVAYEVAEFVNRLVKEISGHIEDKNYLDKKIREKDKEIEELKEAIRGMNHTIDELENKIYVLERLERGL